MHDGAMNPSGRGRPRVQETADDVVASVLATAGAQVSTSMFSTRRIAEMTGLSQTLVSRAVRRIRSGGQATPPAGHAPPTGCDLPELQVERFVVQYPVITIQLAALGAPAPGRHPGLQRRAAAVLAALLLSGAQEWPTGETDTAGPSAAGSLGAATDPLLVTWEPGAGSWSEFLGSTATLLSRCQGGPDAIPGDLLSEVARRAGPGLDGLVWARNQGPSAASLNFDSLSSGRAGRHLPRRPSTESQSSSRRRSITEQVAVALRQEMLSVGLQAGDRVSVGALALRLDVGQATVRSALRELADDELLDHTEGAFRIPRVTGTDVIDLYASRLQVGMVVLRACATQPRHRLLPARLALGTLEAVATHGSLADAGEADLRFQQQLAEASGLRQSAHSFHRLTLRVRVFISVLQLDYSPTVDRLVADDRRLLVAVLEGRGQEAVRIWRSKLDDAVRHMSALVPDSFDPRLWSQLTR